MAAMTASCPLTREQVIQHYFLEHRARLLDVAAYLDRLDRAQPAAGGPDFREAAMRAACRILTDGQPNRAARILALLSDDTPELPQSAHGMKGASGAVKLGGGAE
jgi:hypothetical protein